MSEPEIVSKGEFAELCGVSAGRVTQWINEGKISGSALVGAGRSARIDVAIARGQLKLRRDVGQTLGNGLETKLGAQRAAARVHEDQDKGEPIDPTSTDDVDRKLKLSKLEAAERANRIAAAEEAALQGLYTETASVRAEYGKIASQMLRTIEGALPDFATGLAAEFRIEAREVTLFLNEQFRKVRERATAQAEAAARLVAETLDPDAI